MTITLPIWRWIRSFLSAESTPTNTSEGRHLQILADPSEWKYAGAIAFVLFVASLLIAPALTRDHRKLASEINAKTLKAAATLKTSPTPSQHKQRPGAGSEPDGLVTCATTESRKAPLIKIN